MTENLESKEEFLYKRIDNLKDVIQTYREEVENLRAELVNEKFLVKKLWAKIEELITNDIE